MTKAIHVSSFDRDRRRKIAKDAIVKVREKGVRKAHTKLLLASLFGIATQEQMPLLVALDEPTLEALEPATRRAGRIYESIRQELVFRVCTKDNNESSSPHRVCPPSYETITWTPSGQKAYRQKVFDLWQDSDDDEILAMLYTIACMPLQCWHWRLCIWTARKEIIPPTDHLRRVVLRTAGARGEDIAIQGLDYLEYKGRRQANVRMKKESWLPDFQRDEVHEDERYFIRDGIRYNATSSDFVDAWFCWKNFTGFTQEERMQFRYDLKHSPSYREYLKQDKAYMESEEYRLFEACAGQER